MLKKIVGFAMFQILVASWAMAKSYFNHSQNPGEKCGIDWAKACWEKDGPDLREKIGEIT